MAVASHNSWLPNRIGRQTLAASLITTLLPLLLVALPAPGLADDPIELPPIDVGGSSGCGGPQPTHGFTAGCSGSGGGGGSSDTGGTGGETGFGDGGGGGIPGSSQNNPRPTLGESADCPADATTREGRALEQIRATLGVLGCSRNEHIGVYFLINFPGGATGVYRGTDSNCVGSHIAFEQTAPNC